MNLPICTISSGGEYSGEEHMANICNTHCSIRMIDCCLLPAATRCLPGGLQLQAKLLQAFIVTAIMVIADILQITWGNIGGYPAGCSYLSPKIMVGPPLPILPLSWMSLKYTKVIYSPIFWRSRMFYEITNIK